MPDTRMLYQQLVEPKHVELSREKRNTVSVIHLNARSLINKIDQLTSFLDEFCFNFSILMITETWFTPNDIVPGIPGYKNFSVCRAQKRGGGVAMYVSDALSPKLLPQFTAVTPNYEALSVLVNNTIFAVLYRPPSGDVNHFIDFVDSLLEYASYGRYRLVLGGDFNINLFSDTSMSKSLINRVTSCGFKNVINSPTRITATSSSILDIFITNADTPVTASGTISSDISDHCPIFIAYSVSAKAAQASGTTLKCQHITPFNLDAFREKIQNSNWSQVLAQCSADSAYDSFMEIFQKHYSESFPVKEFRPRRQIRKPWIGPEQFKLINEKNKLYRHFLSTRNLSVLAAFKKLRNRLTSELRKAKAHYYQQLFSDASHRPDYTWKIINDALGMRRNPTDMREITVDGVVLSRTSLSEHFNRHFISSIADTTLPSAEPCTLGLTASETLFLLPTDYSEVHRTFLSLKNSKATDTDNIQIRPVKYVLDCICPSLVHIFNLCLESGCFPSKMKRARVSAIYKAGDKNVPTNYRPISVLPVFSKGLEKIILPRLESFFSKHKMLSPRQHGFRKGYSTESALLMQKEIVLKNIELDNPTLGVFVDYSKAFDSISHETLLKKLYRYGVRGVPHLLLKSYLTDRMQSVVMNGYPSSFQNILFGVPQGSVLGPFLFNVYVNDIVNIDEKTEFVLYADDTSLFITSDSTMNLFSRANFVLSKLLDWSNQNSLKINVKKSKAIIFTAKNKRIHISNELYLGSSRIDIVKEHKILGVVFAQRMTWNSHIELLAKKLSSAVGALYRCRDIFPVSVKLQIYNALFRSHLNYCTLVWGTTTKKNINTLLLLEKKAIRCISNVPYLHPTKQLFEQHNIINIQNLYKYRLLYYLHFSSTAHHAFLVELSGLSLRTETGRTRERDKYVVPRRRTDYYLQSLSHNIPVMLNRLHPHTAECDRFSRKELHSLIFNDKL